MLNGQKNSYNFTLPNGFDMIGGKGIGVYGGFSGSRGYYYNGSIANVQIYNRALSAAEILQNYNATKWRFGL